jgi:hypothetical protein
MNTQILNSKSVLALSLLGVEYALLGWYLAAHHIFGLVGTFVVISTLVIAWKSNPVLELLAWLIKQQVLVVIVISLLFSVLVALTLVKPILLSLIVVPFITLLYALLEMRAAAFRQTEIFLWSIIITSLALGLGEAVDLFITPSMRY